MKFKIIFFIFLLFVNCGNLVKNKSDEIIIGSVEYNYFVNSTNEWYTEYDHKKFIKECKKYKNLIPIAGLNPKKSSKKISQEIKLRKSLGF